MAITAHKRGTENIIIKSSNNIYKLSPIGYHKSVPSIDYPYSYRVVLDLRSQRLAVVIRSRVVSTILSGWTGEYRLRSPNPRSLTKSSLISYSLSIFYSTASSSSHPLVSQLLSIAPYYYQQKLEDATKEDGGEIVLELIHQCCFTKEMPLILKFPDSTIHICHSWCIP